MVKKTSPISTADDTSSQLTVRPCAHKHGMSNQNVREYISNTDFLTLLFWYPEYFHHMMCGKDRGIMKYMKTYYGTFWKTCKPLIQPLTSILKSKTAPCMRRKAFIFSVLSVLEDVKPVQELFRKSMRTQQQKDLYEAFLLYLTAQHQRMRTTSFDIKNTVSLVDDFVRTIMVRGWMCQSTTFLRDHNKPPVEVSLKKDVSVEEFMNTCKTNETVKEKLAEL